MKRKWIDTNVTILGLSKSGIASAKYLVKKGAHCIISEKRAELPEDQEQINELRTLGIQVEMGEHKEDTILNADLIITSPGIPPKSDIIQLIKSHKVQMISEVELAYMETSVPIIAITGTNGKTTTTKLVSEILTNAGYNAPACGNIGIPIIGLIDKPHLDYLVAEISSFQIDTSPVFKPQMAVFLNYTPDHIDWHGSEEAYFNAKATLFTGHRSPVWSVLNGCDLKVYSLREKSLSQVIYFGREMPGVSIYIQNDKIVYKNRGKVQEIIDIKDIPLLGKHNLQNVMAAVAVAATVQVDVETLRSTINTFIPPEHRLEYVTTIDNIKYYNDSKATNCDSTICALKAFENERVVLIAGGKDKGTDLTELVENIKQHAAHVVLIGEAADRFQKAMENLNYTNISRAATLEEAVDISGNLRLGPVLLSPACASFDMFKNFEKRGQAFKEYVIKKAKNS